MYKRGLGPLKKKILVSQNNEIKVRILTLNFVFTLRFFFPVALILNLRKGQKSFKKKSENTYQIHCFQLCNDQLEVNFHPPVRACFVSILSSSPEFCCVCVCTYFFIFEK